jgi:ArsR family transcriptional regulator
MNLQLALKALSNDKRIKILQWLKQPSKNFPEATCDVEVQGVCVGLIEQKIGLSQSTVSQYLKELQQAGLISMERKGQWTYCKRNEAGIQDLIASVQDL